VLDGQELLAIHDMPTLRLGRGGKNRRALDLPELRRLILQIGPASG
jgi:hypothetical protein